MNQAIVDYYRCPKNLADFRLASSGLRGDRVIGPLVDALADVSGGCGTTRIPFDPNEIIASLRHERYAKDGSGLRTRLADSAMVRGLYYRARPFLPLRVRRRVQQARLSDWKKIPFPRWPVDRTVEQLLERLLLLCMEAQGIRRVPFVWFWPDGATSCAIMTHDVEQLAGRKFCSRLMDLDESVGIKSSFQIVPEGRYPVPEEFLEEIRDRGFEINIQDLNHDGRLFSSREEFLHRAARINEYGREYRALGFRSGVLYRNQAWYGALQFSYDMSVPSVGHLEAQRGGCCSVMPFFIGRMLELPLTTVQDYSLFHILNDYSIDLWKQQIDAITAKHGLVSFIVHPDYIIDGRARATYQALLEHLFRMREERKTWIALPREVDRWWRERSQMKVVFDGRGWRVEGRGKERARLAFASIAGDQLTFSVEERKCSAEVLTV